MVPVTKTPIYVPPTASPPVTTQTGGVKTNGTQAFLGTLFSGFGIGLNAFGAYREVKAQNLANQYNAKIAAMNADIDRMRARQAIIEGRDQVQKINIAVAQTIGAQRAGWGRSGISMSSGTPVAVAEDSAREGSVDKQTAMQNARMKRWGLLTSAANNDATAAMYEANQSNPWLAAGASILNEGAPLFKEWRAAHNRGKEPTTSTFSTQSAFSSATPAPAKRSFWNRINLFDGK